MTFGDILSRVGNKYSNVDKGEIKYIFIYVDYDTQELVRLRTGYSLLKIREALKKIQIMKTPGTAVYVFDVVAEEETWLDEVELETLLSNVRAEIERREEDAEEEEKAEEKELLELKRAVSAIAMELEKLERK